MFLILRSPVIRFALLAFVIIVTAIVIYLVLQPAPVTPVEQPRMVPLPPPPPAAH